MSQQTFQIKTQPVPASFCPQDPATDWNTLVALLSGVMPSGCTRFNVGNDVPDPDDQGDPWFRLNSDGSPDRWYSYAAGSWLALHPDFVGKITMWEGAEAGIDTLDGGEAGTVTAVTGPFWEKVSEMDGRFPIGPGTLAGSTDSTASITQQGGDVKAGIKLTTEQMPELQFLFGVEKGSTEEEDEDLQPFGKIRADNDSDITYIQPNTAQKKVGKTNIVGTNDTIEDEIIPPFYGVWFLRRTARLFYRI